MTYSASNVPGGAARPGYLYQRPSGVGGSSHSDPVRASPLPTTGAAGSVLTPTRSPSAAARLASAAAGGGAGGLHSYYAARAPAAAAPSAAASGTLGRGNAHSTASDWRAGQTAGAPRSAEPSPGGIAFPYSRDTQGRDAAWGWPTRPGSGAWARSASPPRVPEAASLPGWHRGSPAAGRSSESAAALGRYSPAAGGTPRPSGHTAGDSRCGGAGLGPGRAASLGSTPRHTDPLRETAQRLGLYDNSSTAHRTAAYGGAHDHRPLRGGLSSERSQRDALAGLFPRHAPQPANGYSAAHSSRGSGGGRSSSPSRSPGVLNELDRLRRATEAALSGAPAPAPAASARPPPPQRTALGSSAPIFSEELAKLRATSPAAAARGSSVSASTSPHRPARSCMPDAAHPIFAAAARQHAAAASAASASAAPRAAHLAGRGASPAGPGGSPGAPELQRSRPDSFCVGRGGGEPPPRTVPQQTQVGAAAPAAPPPAGSVPGEPAQSSPACEVLQRMEEAQRQLEEALQQRDQAERAAATVLPLRQQLAEALQQRDQAERAAASVLPLRQQLAEALQQRDQAERAAEGLLAELAAPGAGAGAGVAASPQAGGCSAAEAAALRSELAAAQAELAEARRRLAATEEQMASSPKRAAEPDAAEQAALQDPYYEGTLPFSDPRTHGRSTIEDNLSEADEREDDGIVRGKALCEWEWDEPPKRKGGRNGGEEPEEGQPQPPPGLFPPMMGGMFRHHHHHHHFGHHFAGRGPQSPEAADEEI
eukprot:TRINITY_DN13938_c0_g1_i2.p1 TRINITY_DN13938_c0_g1~~TRINITY_DN13938_c0_g1_i2.p1  ORF type:complete len:814 (+),score=142.52 TRINITY_DN13938_c0_g1_i2:147-2444(+)